MRIPHHLSRSETGRWSFVQRVPVDLSLSGQRRGRPCLPAIGGKASTSSSNTTESCRLAPVTQNARGTPLRSVIRCRLLPRLPRSVGFGPVYAPPGGSHTGRVQAGPAQVQLVGLAQFGQQDMMQTMPHAGGLPVAQTPPAGHAAAVAQFQRQIFPGDAGAEDVDDAVEGLLITDARSPSLGRGLHWRDQRFDALPQRGGNLFATCHADDFAITAQVFKMVLLAALSHREALSK